MTDGTYLGTRNPSKGMTLLTRLIEDSSEAKSVLEACSCSDSFDFKGPTDRPYLDSWPQIQASEEIYKDNCRNVSQSRASKQTAA